jgi:hypothetical protein
MFLVTLKLPQSSLAREPLLPSLRTDFILSAKLGANRMVRRETNSLLRVHSLFIIVSYALFLIWIVS